MVWLYTVVLLLEDITSVADFRDIVSLNTLKNKFLKDIKNDTDEGAAYLQECFLSLDTKKALNTFVITFYESALVFIMMHEIGHILELDDQTCEELNIISSQSEVSLQEKKIKAEENADLIGHIYSNEYVGEPNFFNMGPILVVLAISINRSAIQIQTDHPSIKNRYESVESKIFDGKNPMDIIHTRKLLYKMNRELQNEGYGYYTTVLTGANSEKEREKAINLLTREVSTDEIEKHEKDICNHVKNDTDEMPFLDYIFTIDIFNEGVDIPEINQVLMLRPTESPIVFVQQLGRGLRKAEGKEYVVIIDFIGNYTNNYMIPIALSGDRSYNKDSIRRYVSEGTRIIPGASTIHFDEISRKRIFQSIDSARMNDVKLLRESFEDIYEYIVSEA